MKKNQSALIYVFSLAFLFSSCATIGSEKSGIELLPPISKIKPGVSAQGTLANQVLISDTISGLESLLGSKIQPDTILKFVIQQPIGPDGKKAWREMWIVPKFGSYIITFSEDGNNSANFTITSMK